MLPGDQISLISARYGSASNNDDDEKSYSDVDYVWSPKLQQALTKHDFLAVWLGSNPQKCRFRTNFWQFWLDLRQLGGQELEAGNRNDNFNNDIFLSLMHDPDVDVDADVKDDSGDDG